MKKDFTTTIIRSEVVPNMEYIMDSYVDYIELTATLPGPMGEEINREWEVEKAEKVADFILECETAFRMIKVLNESGNFRAYRGTGGQAEGLDIAQCVMVKGANAVNAFVELLENSVTAYRMEQLFDSYDIKDHVKYGDVDSLVLIGEGDTLNLAPYGVANMLWSAYENDTQYHTDSLWN